MGQRRGHIARAARPPDRLERFLPGGRGVFRGRRSHAPRASLPDRPAFAKGSIANRARHLTNPRKWVDLMKTSVFMRTLIVVLALEWELCSQDPVIFCYRIGVEPARVFLGRFGRSR